MRPSDDEVAAPLGFDPGLADEEAFPRPIANRKPRGSSGKARTRRFGRGFFGRPETRPRLVARLAFYEAQLLLAERQLGEGIGARFNALDVDSDPQLLGRDGYGDVVLVRDRHVDLAARRRARDGTSRRFVGDHDLDGEDGAVSAPPEQAAHGILGGNPPGKPLALPTWSLA